MFQSLNYLNQRLISTRLLTAKVILNHKKVLKDSPRDCAFENQFKSTNIKTFISKNQEENIVLHLIIIEKQDN